jgi:hypothetical protein
MEEGVREIVSISDRLGSIKLLEIDEDGWTKDVFSDIIESEKIFCDILLMFLFTSLHARR